MFFFPEVQGFIKTVPRNFKNLDQNYFTGSLMEGQHRLEIKCGTDLSKYNLKKGWNVEVEGIMEQFSPGPPILLITDDSKIKILSKEQLPFEVVYAGYKTNISVV